MMLARVLGAAAALAITAGAALTACNNPESRKAANEPAQAAAAAEGTTEAPTESASATAGAKTADR